jgi:predicted CXXCH cytochrome family protein
MPGRPHPKLLRRAVTLLLLCSLIGWVGCGSPRERYKTLSFFFDGVPNPDAPKVVRTAAVATTGPGQVKHLIASTHKPFADNQCDACHRSSAGQIMDFEEAYSACVRCHKDVTTKYARMHGPVARAACRWCHTPHEATEPVLLKMPVIKVCTQCHDQQLLGSNPPQHGDGITSCIACHNGHGGTQALFLKPDWKAEWPKLQAASNPATTNSATTNPAEPTPATAPATAPATGPAPDARLTDPSATSRGTP